MAKNDNNTRQDDVHTQHAIIGVQTQTTDAEPQRTTHPDAQWFPDAGLGLFIHWGISAVEGVGDLSWSMMKRPPGYRTKVLERYGPVAIQGTMTPRRYWQQAERFAPDRYEPAKWLQAAKDAGCTYAVLTTRHHDGFALWPSDHGNFSTKNHLHGQDLVKTYVDACREVGLKVGFYYSPPDWYFNQDRMSFHYGDEPVLGVDHEPVSLEKPPVGKDPRMDDSFRKYIHGQVQELLTRYGRIDLLWFDGRAHNAISIDEIRQLQPHIVVNGRGHGVGDFATHECKFPDHKPDPWWEYCHIMNDGAWGYLKHETYKPAGWALSEMIKARCWGGNFLLNVGPDARGQLPDVYYRRMQEIGAWIDQYKTILSNLSPGPWPQRCNMPVSAPEADRWHLFLPFDRDDVVWMDNQRDPHTVIRLDTNESVTWSRSDDGRITIDIPSSERSVLVDVIEIRW